MDLSGGEEVMSERKKSVNQKDGKNNNIRDFYMNLRRLTNLLL